MPLLTIPVGPLQCNCYVVWEDPDQAVVVDPGDEPDRILETLTGRGLTPRLILNTHGHFDHVGAVAALRDRFQAKHRIHEADVPILQMVPSRSKLWGLEVPDIPKPTHYVADGDRFTVGGLTVDALHTPGHTPGSTCFRVASQGLLMTGDTLFLQSIGRTDFPGGDPDQILKSIRERILTLPPGTRVLPGHGPPTSVSAEAASNPFLS